MPVDGDRALLSRRTELVLRELHTLPTLPVVATKLLALGFDEKVEIREIVRLIESDPSLTARLLSLCRRAAMKTRHPITTVELAVVMLGLDAVRSLVLSVEIFDWSDRTLGKSPETPRAGERGFSRFNRVGFWQHSIAVACAAELLAREIPDFPYHAEEAFVCGLVHDLGKLALDLVLPRAYGRVIELSEARQGNIANFERPIVGLDHHDAGVKLAEHWGLPKLLLDVVAFHGDPASAVERGELRGSTQRMVELVRAADTLCRQLNLGWSGNHAGLREGEEPTTAVGVGGERLAALVPKLYEATSARCRDLGLGEEPSQQLLIESILRANGRLGRLNQELADANRALEEAQQQLAESRALARLGEMTAGAAHEMNNPLTVICGRAQTLEERARDELDRASAKAIVAAGTKLTDLITRLNRIAAPPPARLAPVELADLLSDVVRLAKRRATVTVGAGGRSVAPSGKTTPVPGVKLTIGENLDPLLADRELLTEALVEIVVNALESGPRSPVEVRVDVDPREDRMIVQVIDDGAGMSTHALAHATDPFFSEKPAGRQPGLGLALAHRLVQLHRGELHLDSRQGRGTTATITLPGWRSQRDRARAPSRVVLGRE